MKRRAKPCAGCGHVFQERRSLVIFEGNARRKGPVRCLKCAGLGGFVFLAAGDAKLTRRASKYSPTRGVVVRRRRSFTQRFGVLVEPSALCKAVGECDTNLPEASFKRIAGTKIKLPPDLSALQPSLAPEDAARDARLRLQKFRARQATRETPKVKPKKTRSAQPRSTSPRQKTISQRGVEDRVFSLIRQAYPDCSKHRARKIAEYARSLPETRALLEEKNSADRIGVLVSKYLRRRQTSKQSW